MSQLQSPWELYPQSTPHDLDIGKVSNNKIILVHSMLSLVREEGIVDFKTFLFKETIKVMCS